MYFFFVSFFFKYVDFKSINHVNIKRNLTNSALTFNTKYIMLRIRPRLGSFDAGVIIPLWF